MDAANVALSLGLAFVVHFQYKKYKRRNYLDDFARNAVASREKEEANKGEDKKEGSKGCPVDHNLGGKENDMVVSTWRVHNLLTALELQFEAWISMSARGLLSTYGIPSIASVLHKSGGFEKDIDRRYADMELMIREFNENAPDGTTEYGGQPKRAKVSLYRLNAIHNKYANIIKYDDMLYVWSIFATVPFMWMESRWSARRMSKNEREAVYWHWIDIGRLLNLNVRGHFKCHQDVVDFRLEYEAKHMRYTKSNQVIAYATVEYFVQGTCSTYNIQNKFMQGLLRQASLYMVSALQESPLHRTSLGLPEPPLWLTVSVDMALSLRAFIYRWCEPVWSFEDRDRLTGKSGVPIFEWLPACCVPNTDDDDSSELKATRDPTVEAMRIFAQEEGLGEVGANIFRNDRTPQPLPEGRCPHRFKVKYKPTRGLDFGNRTYTPEDGKPYNQGGAYSIEDMGPNGVPSGILVKDIKYVGHPEGPIE